MSQVDMLSINAVAAKLGLSVHQLRRWELMFGLEIKRGRGQQRQYRAEDMSVLERIKELVEQGWPTSQIRPQLEAEGLVTPKLIGMPPPPGNPEVLSEALIGFRNFTERRFIEISKQIDELRQLLISITLKQELQGESTSPWQPVQREFAPEPKPMPAQEISIGPDFSAGPPVEFTPPPPPPPQRTSIIGAPAPPKESTFEIGPSSSSLPSPSIIGMPSNPGERRSIIGEPSSPVPPAVASPSIGMSEEEADALLEEEDLDEELEEELAAVVHTPPAPPQPSVANPSSDSLLDNDDLEEEKEEVEEQQEDEPLPPPAAPTITPVVSSSSAMATQSGGFSPVGGDAPVPPQPPADPFKSSPFLASPTPTADLPKPPDPFSSGPPAPPAPEPASSFEPAQPALTPAAAGDMFSSVIQSVNDAALRETAPEPPPSPKPQEAEAPNFMSSPPAAPPPPVPPQPVPGPGGTPFTPPSADSSPFIPTPSSSASSPFLTPPPAPYMSGPAPQPPAQPFEPPAAPEPEPAPPAPPEPPKAPPAPAQKGPFLGEITDQNYLTILGRALDLVGWSDEQADSFSVNRFKVPHWDELGRSQAEVLIEHLLTELQTQMSSEG